MGLFNSRNRNEAMAVRGSWEPLWTSALSSWEGMVGTEGGYMVLRGSDGHAYAVGEHAFGLGQSAAEAVPAPIGGAVCPLVVAHAVAGERALLLVTRPLIDGRMTELAELFAVMGALRDGAAGGTL